ncbi:sigma-70 family RNA polymerase sigma factor [Myxococcota bacterium]|nr:sigma-70 family RNA polymerase sigma factor [Myxococcota bacterium]
MTTDVSQLELHRPALVGHCYRMLGSALDADDAVQETMVRAWRALDGFDGRASLRTWLFRIATNVCLDTLGDRKRTRPLDESAVGTVDDELVPRERTHWLEPVPDARVLPATVDPAERAMLKESIRLAFVAALQHLPPRQRAALLMTEVLGWSAAEVAESLDMTVAAVNSALQRARATLESRGLGERAKAPPEDRERARVEDETVERFVRAFEAYDVDALTSLLRADATMSMPPFTLWLRGHTSIAAWLLGRGAGCRGSRLVPTTGASGAPAFGQYKPSPDGKLLPWALVVLDVDGAELTNMTYFLDTEVLFPLFGLPPSL